MTAVTSASASSVVKWNFGMRRSSSGRFSLPLSKTRGSIELPVHPGGQGVGDLALLEAEIETLDELAPSSVSSTPMGVAFSKPGTLWQPKQP